VNNERIKVLYIAGCGRSGSTILHNLLQQLSGFCAVGELRHVWDRGFIKNKLCGCGVPFGDCAFWQSTAHEAFGGMDQVDAAAMHQFIEGIRLHDLPKMLLPRRQEQWRSQSGDCLRNIERLYRAIQSVSGCRVVVDSSKNPAYGYALTMVDTLDVKVLHLVRDSRAVAHSWSTQKLFEPLSSGTPEYMARKHPIRGSLQWIARNMAATKFLRKRATQYQRLLYEHFVKDPAQYVRDILAFVGEGEVPVDFISGTTVDMQRANHSVFGNLVRFQTGTVSIRSDERWRRDMTKMNRIAVTALTLPSLLRCGYFRRSGSPHRRPLAPARPETPSDTQAASRDTLQVKRP